jgi:hypothetical protein
LGEPAPPGGAQRIAEVIPCLDEFVIVAHCIAPSGPVRRPAYFPCILQ